MRRIHIFIYTVSQAALLAMLSGCGDSTVSYCGGTYQGDTKDGLPDGYGTWSDGESRSYTGFWAAGKRSGSGVETCRDTVYRGGFMADRRSGYGILTVSDSVLYSGEWSSGVRQGHGHAVHACPHETLGVWNADTVASGKYVTDGGLYSGEMSSGGLAAGHGTFQTSGCAYYEGHWADGRRDGFGFSLSPSGRMRAGEWRGGRYLGERMVYTSDRIYGIDISKYQHVIGRKKYSIDWKSLRITHLGTISRKRISGTADYPVSFIYIKSTEGTTLRNTYYATDYTQARRHGLRVGSYHFFSHRTDAAAQARFFLKHSKFKSGDFPPVLDVEPTAKQIEQMGGAKEMFRRIQTWLTLVERSTGCRPVLYVSQSFVNQYLDAAPAVKNRYQVWIARYGEYKPDVRLAYWQLCPDGRVRGIQGEVDINVFNGYRQQFEQFCASYCIR